jgi:formate dehydrogenase iron-sulfur subunit
MAGRARAGFAGHSPHDRDERTMNAEPALPDAGSRDDIAAAVAAALERHANRPGALLPVLHEVQQRLGWLPGDCVPPIARALNLSRAEVHGVVTFYHHFRRTPPGRHVVQVCQAEACRSMGAEGLMTHAQARLRCAAHGCSDDGRFSLEPVYCLGQCANAPAAMLDGQVHARLTPQRFDALVTEIAAPPALAQPRSPDNRPATATIFVPRDSTALAVGADGVAAAIAATAAERGLDIALVRNGSRGLFWLEPLVEVATAEGRIGYGPVSASDVAALFDAGFHAGGAHPLRLGSIDDLPWLKSQQRLTFARIGLADPLSLADYERHGGLAGLRRALAMAPEAIVAEVTDSGLRGRGGAAFPTGIKWRTAARAEGRQKYVVCNADEGDSGSFADRLLMESDPLALIEGMAIAGLAVGASRGYIYVRSEYPQAVATLQAAIAIARDARLLGGDILGSGRAFELEVRVGAGSYVCGEETAMLESLEGKRGIVRAKPPLPAIAGLFGMPTVVNNVVTLATVPLVLARGAAFHRDVGTGRSRGTLALQLAGNVKRGGLVEVAFGLTLRELVETWGGGTASGRPVRAIQVGGPLGTYVPPQHWDTPLDYEAYSALGHVIGHGSVVVHDDTVDLAKMARFAMEFCALESCGKCTPCRIGSVRGVEIIDRIVDGRDRAAQVALLRELAETMTAGSLCAMGGMTPYPVLSALEHYPQDFGVEHERDRTAPAR